MIIMLSKLFEEVKEEILNRIIIDKESLNKILLYIQEEDEGCYIYGEFLVCEFCVDANTIFEILDILESKDVVAAKYKLVCPRCFHITGKYCDYLTQLEEIQYCENCDCEIFLRRGITHIKRFKKL